MNDKEQINFPYPGLRPFFDYESAYFYGRDSQVKEIISRLTQVRFVAVLGDSGSGKSSVVRAGVIPSLRQYSIPDAGDFWIPIVMSPGTNLSKNESAITRLSKAFCACLKELSPEEEIKRREKCTLYLRGTSGLSTIIEHYNPELNVPPGPSAENANFLFVFDQFEELFHPSNDGDNHKDDRECFVDLIFQHVNSPNNRVYIILTMRSEHLNDCATFLRLPDAINGASYLIRRLEPYEINQAIELPVKYFQRVAMRKSIENNESTNTKSKPEPIEYDADVLDRIHKDVEKLHANSDHLPLLQHLLNRIWDAANNRTKPELPEKILMVDLRKAISANNDEILNSFNDETISLQFCLENWSTRIYNSLDSKKKKQIEIIFRNLAYKNPTTGMYTQERLSISDAIFLVYRVKLDQLNKTEQAKMIGEIRSLLEPFMSFHEYLVEENNYIKVTHESFIRGWALFKEWIDNEAERFEEYYALLAEYRTSKQNETNFTLTDNRVYRINELKVKEFFYKDQDRVINRLINIKIKDQSWNEDIKKLPEILKKYLFWKDIAKTGRIILYVAVLFTTIAGLIFLLTNSIEKNKDKTDLAAYKVTDLPPIPGRNNSYYYKSINEPRIFFETLNQEIIKPYKQSHSKIELLQKYKESFFMGKDEIQLSGINLEPRINKKIKDLLVNALWEVNEPKTNLISLEESSDSECYAYGINKKKSKKVYYSRETERGLIDVLNINQNIWFNIVQEIDNKLYCMGNGLHFPMPPEEYLPKAGVDARLNYFFLSLSILNNKKNRRLSIYKLIWPKYEDKQRGIELVHFMTMDFKDELLDHKIQIIDTYHSYNGETIVRLKNGFFKLLSKSPVPIKNSSTNFWWKLDKIKDDNDSCKKLMREKFKNLDAKFSVSNLPEPFKSSNDNNFCYVVLDQSVYIYSNPKNINFKAQQFPVITKVDFGELASTKEWFIGKPGTEYEGWIAVRENNKEDLVGLAWSTDALLKITEVLLKPESGSMKSK